MSPSCRPPSPCLLAQPSGVWLRSSTPSPGTPKRGPPAGAARTSPCALGWPWAHTTPPLLPARACPPLRPRPRQAVRNEAGAGVSARVWGERGRARPHLYLPGAVPGRDGRAGGCGGHSWASTALGLGSIAHCQLRTEHQQRTTHRHQHCTEQGHRAEHRHRGTAASTAPAHLPAHTHSGLAQPRAVCVQPCAPLSPQPPLAELWPRPAGGRPGGDPGAGVALLARTEPRRGAWGQGWAPVCAGTQLPPCWCTSPRDRLTQGHQACSVLGVLCPQPSLWCGCAVPMCATPLTPAAHRTHPYPTHTHTCHPVCCPQSCPGSHQHLLAHRQCQCPGWEHW